MSISKGAGFPSIDKPWLKYYTEDAIATPLPECTIYEYLYENNRNYLDNVALNYFDRRITYGEIFENIEMATKGYSFLGLKKGDIVTVCAVTLPETIYSFYGLNRLGVICNMVDPRTSVEGISEYIKEVKSKVVITIDVAYTKIVEAIQGTDVKKIVVISPADSLPQPKKSLYKLFKATRLPKDDMCIAWSRFLKFGENESPDIVQYEKDTACVIVHTGGTTGMPKGVLLSNDNLNKSAAQAILSGFDFQRGHTWLNIMPPFIAYGVGNGLHLPLVIGMEVILIPSFDPDKFADLLNKYRPNHMVGVPSHYGNIIHNRKMEGKDLSYIIAPTVGGDAMDISLEIETNEFLKNHNCLYPACKGYGMSEVSAGVSACSSHEVNKIGSVGIPLTHTTMAIFDTETGEELSYNQEGELCMTGPNTMLGYYNNEEATNAIIKEHIDGLKWVHSGDVGYIDEDGFIFIKDRIKRVIIRHDGFKVFPSLIEKTIDSNKYILSNCAVGVSDKTHSQGKLPVVFAVLNESVNPETVKVELFALCQKELPEYAQPIDFVFIDEMPLTPIGKVDYRSLEEMTEKLFD